MLFEVFFSILSLSILFYFIPSGLSYFDCFFFNHSLDFFYQSCPSNILFHLIFVSHFDSYYFDCFFLNYFLNLFCFSI